MKHCGVQRGEVERATGLSFLPRGQKWPLKTEFLWKQFVFSVQLPQAAAHHSTRQSHCASLSLLPAVSRSRTTNIPFVVLSESCLQSTCATCPWQVKRIFLRRSRVAASAVQPPIHPTLRPPPLLCPRLFPPLAFSILSCRGKRWPEESNNCDSGAFLALFLKLCRHTQGCLLALMKG